MASERDSLPRPWMSWVPHTPEMDRVLQKMDETTKVVGCEHGLPVIRYAKSGRRMVVTTTGRLERLR